MKSETDPPCELYSLDVLSPGPAIHSCRAGDDEVYKGLIICQRAFGRLTENCPGASLRLNCRSTPPLTILGDDHSTMIAALAASLPEHEDKRAAARSTSG